MSDIKEEKWLTLPRKAITTESTMLGCNTENNKSKREQHWYDKQRKLTKEVGQCTLSEFEFTRSESPTRSVKQRTPPSTEKPDLKQINMLNPEQRHTNNTVAFDFAAMEQRIIASYRESMKQEVSEALKPLESCIDELLQIKSKTDRISGEMKK